MVLFALFKLIILLFGFALLPLSPFLPASIHIWLGNYRNIGEFEIRLLLGCLSVFAIHDIQSVQLKEDDQSVFAREEHVHVRNDLKVRDDEEPKHQERGVL